MNFQTSILWFLLVNVSLFHCSKEFHKILKPENIIDETEIAAFESSTKGSILDVIFKRFIRTTEEPSTVEQKIKALEKEIKKICKNELKIFTFTLPNSRKNLTFKKTKPGGPDSKILNAPVWKLTHVNHEKTFLTEIEFSIFTAGGQGAKMLYLSTLYPGYPNVSGIDIMTFLMTICAICDLHFVTRDGSDLTTPYMHLYEQNYYQATIMGKNKIIKSHNIPIEKGEFLICVDILLKGKEEKFALNRLCEEKLKLCENEKELKPENCPITKTWFPNLLHKYIFPTCLKVPHIGVKRVEYSVSIKNMHDIWNKNFSPETAIASHVLKSKLNDVNPNTYEEMREHCHIDKLERNIQQAIHFCAKDIIEFTPFHILKLLFPCVKHEIELLFKYGHISK